MTFSMSQSSCPNVEIRITVGENAEKWTCLLDGTEKDTAERGGLNKHDGLVRNRNKRALAVLGSEIRSVQCGGHLYVLILRMVYGILGGYLP